LAPLPPKTMLPCGIRVASDEVAERIRPVTDESTSRTVKGMAWEGVLAAVCWLAMTEMVGASLTAATETLKDRVVTLLLAWPSLTVTVMVALPLASASGVNLSVAVALGLA
jgi:hypothetical protein